MFLDIGIRATDNLLFNVPHREKPMKAKHICRKFPSFAAEFDGSATECTLLWYYKLNRDEGVFEFKDPEAEEEVAELMGVKVYTGDYEDEESKGSSKSLSKEEITAVHDYLADVREGLKKLEV